ncbi:rab effector Noc2 isoform X2 [Electrophorus electricus]|uniref:rab effector Noc2 isoform X2 n=1 Tax=Electrophorus electricus TaxID=8005 RepID=UPI0015D075BD|nr:rab effector Noc2 isoform X2 [Electrophorus electricus]
MGCLSKLLPHASYRNMTDTMFGNGNDQWVCPNDRQLALRAKLHTGWSVHTFQTEKQRRRQVLSERELDTILSVIQRAEQLDLVEQQRIGRLVERLQNMQTAALGNGLSQCLLCGEALGLLGTPSVFCLDCCKKVCTKCGIETPCSQKRTQWLCKICSEQREVWKRSGAWFYKALPRYIRPVKDSLSDIRRPVAAREEQPVARSLPATYTWAHSKVDSSESDVSDSELSEASSNRKTFIPGSIKRRHSALSESSGSVTLAAPQLPLPSPSRTSLLSDSPSSLGSGSRRSSSALAPDDQDAERGRPSSNLCTGAGCLAFLGWVSLLSQGAQLASNQQHCACGTLPGGSNPLPRPLCRDERFSTQTMM